MAQRFNPPPGWPTPPEGFVPGPGWQPDPSWPAAPSGWQFWVSDAPGDPTAASYAPPGTPAGTDEGAPGTSAGAGDWAPGTPAGVGAGAPQTSAEAGYWQPPGPAPTAYSQPPAGPAPGAYDQSPGSGWAVPAPQPSGTSGLAVAAFVLGLLGFVVITAILGVVLGAVALGHIRRSLQGGKTLAILGIVLGGGWLVLLVALIVIGAAVSPPSGSKATGSQSVQVTSLATGDCFDLPTRAVTNQSAITSVEKIQCARPHNAQVFATFPVSGALLSYPGTTRLNSLADSGCAARIKQSVNRAEVTISMSMKFLFPLPDTWLGGNRTITCIIYSPTSTMRSSVLTR